MCTLPTLGNSYLCRKSNLVNMNPFITIFVTFIHCSWTVSKFPISTTKVEVWQFLLIAHYISWPSYPPAQPPPLPPRPPRLPSSSSMRWYSRYGSESPACNFIYYLSARWMLISIFQLSICVRAARVPVVVRPISVCVMRRQEYNAKLHKICAEG